MQRNSISRLHALPVERQKTHYWHSSFVICIPISLVAIIYLRCQLPFISSVRTLIHSKYLARLQYQISQTKQTCCSFPYSIDEFFSSIPLQRRLCQHRFFLCRFCSPYPSKDICSSTIRSATDLSELIRWRLASSIALFSSATQSSKDLLCHPSIACTRSICHGMRVGILSASLTMSFRCISVTNRARASYFWSAYAHSRDLWTRLL